jgi:hypothetical protein
MNEQDLMIKTQSRKFETLLKIAAENFVDSMNIVEVSDAAFEAMLKAIDNQSRYYSAEDYKSIGRK